jgi:phosphoribosylaminoimidazole-succinocarboxamide synthase
MNDDFMKRAAEQAQELQRKIAEALGQSEKLRETIFQQARASADLTNEQTKSALDNLDAAMKNGTEFLQSFLRGR